MPDSIISLESARALLSKILTSETRDQGIEVLRAAIARAYCEGQKEGQKVTADFQTRYLEGN